MTKARIFKPAKTAMQSGTANAKRWLLEFEPGESRVIEPVMGWFIFLRQCFGFEVTEPVG